MKNRKQLLLLHGALGSKIQFKELKKMLDPNFEVHLFNFSGHGNNTVAGKFSMEVFQKDVLEYMENHAIESAAIFGYSMGGYVGLKLAHDFPEKVERLMTLGTKIQWNPEIAAKEVQLLDPEAMEVKIPKFAEFLKNVHDPNDWKSVVGKTAEMMHGLGNGNALIEEEFKSIDIPVLIARGSEDNMVTREESESLAGILKKGNFMEIPNGKHPWAQVETPVLAQLLLDFFTI